MDTCTYDKRCSVEPATAFTHYALTLALAFATQTTTTSAHIQTNERTNERWHIPSAVEQQLFDTRAKHVQARVHWRFVCICCCPVFASRGCYSFASMVCCCCCCLYTRLLLTQNKNSKESVDRRCSCRLLYIHSIPLCVLLCQMVLLLFENSRFHTNIVSWFLCFVTFCFRFPSLICFVCWFAFDYSSRKSTIGIWTWKRNTK